jgi:hypothetical protein
MNNAPLETLSTMRYMGRSEPVGEVRRGARFPAFHPVLVAVFPPLALYAQNPSSVVWWEVLAAMAVTLVGTGLVYALARRLYSTQQAAALATTWTVLLIFGYGLVFHVKGALAGWDVPVDVSPRTVLPLWGAALACGLWCIGHRRADLRISTHCAHVFAVCAVAGPIALVLLDTGGNLKSLIGRNVEIKTVGPLELKKTEPLPDIYYLVVSGYADGATLKSEFQVDNRPFLDGLERRGFAIAEQSKANYPTPELAMASALNLCYLGENIGAKAQYNHLLDQSRVARELKKLGYRYYHLGGPVDGLRRSSLADENYRFSRMPSGYTDRLVSLTPFGMWLAGKDRRTQMREKFDRLDHLARQNGPKFVMMYVSALQPPWTFDARGNPISRRMASERGDAVNYDQQLKHVNHRLERAIDAILSYSKGEAVIVVQSDEGPRIPRADVAPNSGQISWDLRRGVLTAVYLPDGKTRRGVVAPLSPVNTLRLVLHVCFGAELPRLSDDTYIWQTSDANGAPLYGRNLRLENLAAPARGAELARSPR